MLNFKIENFSMTKDESQDPENLIATFNVKGIRIKSETVSSEAQQENDTNDVQNTENTNDTANNSAVENTGDTAVEPVAGNAQS